MDTSAVFRQNNEILYSAKILRANDVSQQVGHHSVSSGPTDTLDLNHSGKVSSHFDSAPHGGKTWTLDEPSIVSPKLDKIEALAKDNQAEVVTQADLPEGVFVSDKSFSVSSKGHVKSLDAALKPMSTLVNDLPDKLDPNARYALDFHTGEMLIYKPAPGGVCDNLVTTDSGLKYGIMKEGQGDPVKPNQLVAVQYSGWLENGKKFDSTDDRNGKPFVFQVGAHNVIPGWDEGVAGMKQGETRRLVIPPALGYGAKGAGDDIPPNSTLIFNVHLLAFKDPPAPEPAPTAVSAAADTPAAAATPTAAAATASAATASTNPAPSGT